MCQGLPRQIDCVSAELRAVIFERRPDFRICPALRIVDGEAGTVIPHDMGGHIAGGVIN